MEKFIEKLAKELVSKHGNDFTNVIVVFSNKRAGLFLKKELTKLIDKPIWSPDIISISDFFNKYSGLRIADNLELLFELYNVYNRVFPDVKFEEFIAWGNILIKDFNDIDNYLIDAKQLYRLINDFSEIENNFGIDLSNENTRKDYANYITFWEAFFNKSIDEGSLKSEFSKIWSNLHSIYSSFREALLEKKIAYQGLESRFFLENVNYLELIQQSNITHIYFCGLNALSNVENTIINKLVLEGIAYEYKDIDVWYLNDNQHEAGYFLRKKIDINSKLLYNEKWITNELAYTKKFFHIIGATSDIAQCSALQSELIDIIDKGNFEQEETAIITANENIILPLISILPPQINDINVTMGFPLKNTITYSFVESVIKLQLSLKKGSTNEKFSFNYREFIKILLHPFFSHNKTINDNIIKSIVEKNLVFIDHKFINKNIKDNYLLDLFKPVFSQIEIFKYLEKIVINIFKLNSENKNQIEQEDYMKFENEFLFNCYKTIKKTKTLFENNITTEQPETIWKIVKQLLANISIPFEGEPLKGLQIMGVLETRSLDFKNVFILSVNENILPTNKNSNSYIPYNIRKYFGLPTKDEEEAIYAYNFYRLIQRAENIYLIYNNSPKDDSNGEKSRYIYQIKYELIKEIAKNNNCNTDDIYKEIVYNSHINFINSSAIIIEKSETIYKLLTDRFCKEKYLSPTALYSYSKCSLQFYFKYLLELEEPEEIEEETDARTLGNILHNCMESIYKNFIAKQINTTDLKNIKDSIDEHLKIAFSKNINIEDDEKLSGRNILLFDLLKKTINNFVQFDENKVINGAKIDIIGLEQKYETKFKIGNYSEPINVKGFFDRIDKENNQYLIIDYKTGIVDEHYFDVDDSKNNIDNIFENIKLKEVFQTMIYALIFLENNPLEKTNINVYSMRNQNAPLILNKNNKFFELNSDIIKTFKEKLILMINDIFNKDISFNHLN